MNVLLTPDVQDVSLSCEGSSEVMVRATRAVFLSDAFPRLRKVHNSWFIITEARGALDDVEERRDFAPAFCIDAEAGAQLGYMSHHSQWLRAPYQH